MILEGHQIAPWMRGDGVQSPHGRDGEEEVVQRPLPEKSEIGGKEIEEVDGIGSSMQNIRRCSQSLPGSDPGGRIIRDTAANVINAPRERNFRRKILSAGVIETSGHYRTGDGRPARLYRYRENAVAEVKARRLFP